MLKSTTTRIRTRIGPEDDGRRMSLEQFDRAIGEEGYHYELNKGVIEVTDVPHPRHFAQLEGLRDQLYGYKLRRAGVILRIAASNDAKLLIAPTESERHPDCS